MRVPKIIFKVIRTFVKITLPTVFISVAHTSSSEVPFFGPVDPEDDVHAPDVGPPVSSVVEVVTENGVFGLIGHGHHLEGDVDGDGFTVVSSPPEFVPVVVWR